MVIEDMFLYTFKDLDYDFTYRSPQRLEENPWLKNKSPQAWAYVTMRRLVTSALVGIEYHLVHRFCDSKARHNPLSCPALCTGCSLQYTPEVRNVLSALASHLNKNIPVWTGMLAADLSDDVVHFAIVSNAVRFMWIEVFQTMERHILTLSYSALDVDEQMAFSWVHNSIVDVAKEAGVSIR